MNKPIEHPDDLGEYAITYWIVTASIAASFGVKIDGSITGGDLWGIIDQIDAIDRGWA